MSDHLDRKDYGGGLGAGPGGPQKSAVAVSGRRPAFLAPCRSIPVILVSDASRDDLKVVRPRLRRSWGILVRRRLALQTRTTEKGRS
jgi:hypothetical protein